MAGLPVLDPNGDAVGRVRDVTASRPPSGSPPRVLGLLIELPHRKRIFVPIGRMTSIDADAVVLTSGTVSLQRFSQRPGEQLVLGEMLDRRVTIRESGAAAVVVDLAMEQDRLRNWLLTRVAARELSPSRISRRRGQLHQLAWDELDGLTSAASPQGAEHLLSVLATMRPTDAASRLLDMPHKRQREVAAALDDDRLADILEEMPDEHQVQLLTTLAEDRAADVLGAMDPDDAADLLAELPEPEKERLLALMEPDEADPVRRLMTYADDTAGGLMTSEPVILAPDATVAEALARVRNRELSPALASQVYVCRPPTQTPTGRYLGVVHIQRLLREPPGGLVSGVLDDDLTPLAPDAPLSAVTRMLAAYNMVAAPVVDDADRLVGAVTVDDILDALLPDDWREREDHG
jgi:CBS domain-containing protein